MHLFGGDLGELIKTLGYIGLFFVIFAESGLFFGFFFPGDSVLFTAGFLASQGWFNIWVLVPLMIIAAIGGDSAGFYTGEKFGPWLTNRKSSLLFSKKNLEKAQEFFNTNGGKALILARFIPAVRTFVPIAAGMAGMKYQKFISYNLVGGLLWGAGMTLGGYFLGQLIPNVDHYLLPIVFVIIILSVLPGVIHMRGDIKAIIVKLLAKLP
jgi:membrane-associated protein